MLSATNGWGETIDIQFLGSSADDALGLVTSARARIANMLDMLLTVQKKVGEAVQSAPGVSEGFAVDRASNLSQYVTGTTFNVLKLVPVVTPMVIAGSNVVLWPNDTWDQQAAAWKLLSDFLGGGNKNFALERGALGKVIPATSKMLSDVDAKLAQRDAAAPVVLKPPSSHFPWGWVVAGVVAAAGAVGVAVYATRDKTPKKQLAPVHRRRAAMAGGR